MVMRLMVQPVVPMQMVLSALFRRKDMVDMEAGLQGPKSGMSQLARSDVTPSTSRRTAPEFQMDLLLVMVKLIFCQCRHSHGP